MLLKLIRTYDKKQTNGRLYIDDKYFCTTIERPSGQRSIPPENPLQWQAYLETLSEKSRTCPCCIPEGWYRVEVTFSPRFQRQMPLLKHVPGFTGIRIHAGLSVENTTGCICVGYRYSEDQLTQILIQAQNRHEEIYIAIYNEYSPDWCE